MPVSSVVMDHTIDLDQAAVVLEQFRSDWITRGWQVGQLTWRDERASWPQPLETDRSAVLDPDSVGVELELSNTALAKLVIFRSGWADQDLAIVRTNKIRSECPEFSTVAELATALSNFSEQLTSAALPNRQVDSSHNLYPRSALR